MLPNKNKNFIKILSNLFYIPYFIIFIKYLYYIYSSITFPFDWEPTDGDHLNFSQRINQGKSIYFAASQGHYLSVYNPLYHIVINYIGNGNQDLALTKKISAILWFATIIIIAIFAIKLLGVTKGIFAAVVFAFPPIPNLLIEMLQIGPSSLLAFTFLIAGLLFVKWNKGNYHIFWLLPVIFLTTLTFFAKQQGLILLISIFVYLIISSKLKLALTYISISIITIYLIGTYINSQNDNYFWASTLFDLQKVLTSYWKLGIEREFKFVLYCFPIFFMCLYGIFLKMKFNRQINFWEVSILCHIPFLFFILRNGGGGQNYFVTMWISMILTLILFVNENRDLLEKSVDGARFTVKSKDLKFKFVLYSLLSYLLIFSPYLNIKSLNAIKFPSGKIELNSREFYKQVNFYAPNEGCKALVNRNSYAFVKAGCDIDAEGAITFGYAWNYPEIFDKNHIAKNIICKKYDLISDGINKFPSDVSSLINLYYVRIYSSEVNLYYGYTGIQNIYVPNLTRTSPAKCN